MSTKGYTVIGWVVWQIGSRVAKKKIAQNRVKIGAAGVVVLTGLGWPVTSSRIRRFVAGH